MTEQTTSPESTDESGQKLPSIAEPTTVDEISADVASLFTDFDESHKKELANEEEKAAIETEEYREKANKLEELAASLKNIKYTPEDAFDIVEKLVDRLNNTKKATGKDLPPSVTANITKYEQIKQMLEQRKAAVGDEKVKALEDKIRNSEELKGIFQTLQKTGLSLVTEGAEASRKKEQEAFLKTKEAKAAMDDYPEFAVRSEITTVDLEKIKEVFLERIAAGLKHNIFDVPEEGSTSKCEELKKDLEKKHDNNLQSGERKKLEALNALEVKSKIIAKFLAIRLLEKISAFCKSEKNSPEEQIVILENIMKSVNKGNIESAGQKLPDAVREEISTTLDLIYAANWITPKMLMTDISDNIFHQVLHSKKRCEPASLSKKHHAELQVLQAVAESSDMGWFGAFHVNTDGIFYRPDHREEDLKRYDENMKLLAKFEKELDQEEGVINTGSIKQFHTVKSAVAEIERVRAKAIEAITTLRDKNKAMDLLMRMDELGVEGTKLLREKSEGADVAEKLRKHKAEMQKLGKEIKDLTKKTDLNS